MKTLFPTTAALLVAATPAFAQVMPAREYVATAGASDLFERRSSQLVLATTRDSKIKAFAMMMIADHSKSTAMVTTATKETKLALAPAKLTPLQMELLAELRGERGPARDATYIAQQKAAHGGALTVHQAYAADGKAPALKMVAIRIVPVVKKHIQMLMNM